MSKLIDLTGQIFGRWTVISLVENSDYVKKWNCLCSCGNNGQINSSSLKRGLSSSCGCLQKELKTTHGDYKSPTYNSWDNMIGRCTRPSQPEYVRYGGKGITVDPEWKKSFLKFKQDMGERPPGTTIDRKDVNGNYEPGNCRWATAVEQQNNKTNNVTILLNGKMLSIKEYSNATNIPIQTIRNRLFAGVPKDKLHLTPKQCGL